LGRAKGHVLAERAVPCWKGDVKVFMELRRQA
jgi:hypothetical protein